MAPAGTKNHHAYHGGLAGARREPDGSRAAVSPCYPQINRDLLLMGAFLHDLGKTEELGYDRGLSYTDEGQLIGHLVMAVGHARREAGRGREALRRSRSRQKRCCG